MALPQKKGYKSVFIPSQLKGSLTAGCQGGGRLVFLSDDALVEFLALSDA